MSSKKVVLINIAGNVTLQYGKEKYGPVKMEKEVYLKLKGIKDTIKSEEDFKFFFMKDDNTRLHMLSMSTLLDDPRFTKHGKNEIKLKGINLPIPPQLTKRMNEVIESNPRAFSALINFWMWASLNPDPIAREYLFRFIDRHKFIITPSGYFIAARWVVLKSKGQSAETGDLLDFIANTYLKIKKWKKKVSNYNICMTSSKKYYHLEIDKPCKKDSDILIGNLADLQNDTEILDETIYTDGRTGKMTIQLRKPVSMPREECDANHENRCSSGLHFTGVDSLHEYSSHGGVKMLVLVNPMNVVAFPYESTGHTKGRCCEYFPIATLNKNENVADYFEKLDLYDDSYNPFSIDALRLMVSKNKPEEVNINKLNFKEFSKYSSHLAKSRNEIQKLLQNKKILV